jgi:regulator of protease activity HflC (stomatin/prohibitin superfamily)
MRPAQQVKLGIGIVAAIAVIAVILGLFGKNEDTQFTVKQPIHPILGDIDVVDRGGYYFKNMATVWQWNKFEDFYFSREASEGGAEDQSIRITFNDGGQADVSSYVRIQLPMDKEKRIEFNRQFSGNPENIKSAIRSHLINCLKNTAPMMQSSEHQSARKTEFDQTVRDQLDNGLYSMAKEAVKQKDETDENGQEITVYVTNLVLDEQGQPIVAKESPIAQYGIVITQFSITGVEYDPKTRELFAAKKESSLAAEQSKAERIQETQQRLMVEEKGLREKAEIEAKANVEKAEAVIKAEKEKEMATIEAEQKVVVEEQAKIEAETRLAKELAIAEQEKAIAETVASAALEVAKLKAQAAEEEAKAISVLAVAEEERIIKAGAITEQEQVLAEIGKEQAIGVAEALARIASPSTVISGNGAGAEGSAGEGALQDSLLSLFMLKQVGGIENLGSVKSSNVPKAFPNRAGNYKSMLTPPATPAVVVPASRGTHNLSEYA